MKLIAYCQHLSSGDQACPPSPVFEGDFANPKGRTCDLTWPVTVFLPLPATVISLGLES